MMKGSRWSRGGLGAVLHGRIFPAIGGGIEDFACIGGAIQNQWPMAMRREA